MTNEEFPYDNWCIRITEENKKLIFKWRNTTAEGKNSPSILYNDVAIDFIDYKGGCYQYFAQKHLDIISTENFLKYVYPEGCIKKETIEEKENMEYLIPFLLKCEK